MNALIWTFAALAAVLAAAGCRWQFWRPVKKGFLSLMYHHIGVTDKKDGQFPFTIPPQQFEMQLEMLKKHGFTFIGLRELKAAAEQQKPLPQRPVLLTFDDGYADHFDALFPLLKKHGAKALIFLITDSVGKPGYLTWEQIRQMKQSGLVDFGSHTHTHARLRKLSNEDALKELTLSKRLIEENLQTPCEAFCYPFGSGGFDKRIRPLVFQAGYLFDFSTKPGVNPWPWNPAKTLLRAFPRGGETPTDFYIQITRGKSKF